MASGVDRREGPGPATTDHELAARLMAGDGEALAEAYGQFAGLVFGLCRRVLNDEALAEDVSQDVFVLLWQHPDRFDPSRGSLRSWLALLAHCRSVDRVRAETRRSRAENGCEPLAAPVNEAIDYLTANWLSSRVRDALEKLPSEQREAIVLAYYGGRTYREVAAELAIPEGTAKSRMRLAMGHLKEILGSEHSDQDVRAWT